MAPEKGNCVPLSDIVTFVETDLFEKTGENDAEIGENEEEGENGDTQVEGIVISASRVQSTLARDPNMVVDVCRKGGFVVHEPGGERWPVDMFPKPSCKCSCSVVCRHIIAVAKTINFPLSPSMGKGNVGRQRHKAKPRSEKQFSKRSGHSKRLFQSVVDDVSASVRCSAKKLKSPLVTPKTARKRTQHDTCESEHVKRKRLSIIEEESDSALASLRGDPPFAIPITPVTSPVPTTESEPSANDGPPKLSSSLHNPLLRTVKDGSQGEQQCCCSEMEPSWLVSGLRRLGDLHPTRVLCDSVIQPTYDCPIPTSMGTCCFIRDSSGNPAIISTMSSSTSRPSTVVYFTSVSMLDSAPYELKFHGACAARSSVGQVNVRKITTPFWNTI